MTGAKKIMNTVETIHITDEDRKAAMAMLESMPSITVEDALIKYKSALDGYCEKYSVSTYDELMAMADELRFEPRDCFDILDKYSFIARHQS